MKIKLFPWWTCSHYATERMKKQFIGSHFNDTDIELVTGDDYDYAIVFGFTKEPLKTDKDHTIFFFQEPHWSQNWDREAYKKSNRVYCTSKDLFGNYDEFIEHRSFMFYGGHGDEFFDLDTILNYNNFEKPNKTSFVVTYRSVSPLDGTNRGNIYDKRVHLAETALKRELDVDVFGFLWEYSDYKTSKLKKTIHSKFLALDKYKFSVAIENSREKNYITEKFYDVLFFNTVPVYCGAPNIEEFKDIEGTFIHLKHIEDLEGNLNILSNLNDDVYFEKMKNIKQVKYNLFNSPEYSVWKKIISEVKK
jgi:hypothetical protein